MWNKIGKECLEGSVLGPFVTPSVANLRDSPLRVVPKKVPGEYRLIHHLSYPHGDSVNDTVPEELCSVWYTSFDQALLVVRCCGWPRSWLSATSSRLFACSRSILTILSFWGLLLKAIIVLMGPSPWVVQFPVHHLKLLAHFWNGCCGRSLV